jgi:two-component system sensor histidine kinase CiaH
MRVCAPYREIAESQDKHFWLNLKCPVTIAADETRLHQLLVIFLDNALKYTGENDSIGVKTYTEDQKVVLEVSDMGVGIKEENSRLLIQDLFPNDHFSIKTCNGR